VISLGQVCPAGFEAWSPWRLAAAFAVESLRMSTRVDRADRAKLALSALGFIRGLFGDFARSLASAAGTGEPWKALRVMRDIRDCTILCDSGRFRASHLERIAVAFAQDDTCMDPVRQLGMGHTAAAGPTDIERLRHRFFADVVDASRISLRILPGTHAAPVTHAQIYARTLLADLGELAA
jgi:hypothetical protein